MKRKVPHEITLVAFMRNADGTAGICDIVETSNHYAYYWWRKFQRLGDVEYVQCYKPGKVF